MVVTCCNHKGGTGKTTSTLNVAAAFGLIGGRVLVLDLDPQGFLSETLGVRNASPDASTAALFDGVTAVSDVAVTPVRSFDFIPASRKLSSLMRYLTSAEDVMHLRRALRGVEAYDLILLDTAAAVTVFSLNALAAARVVLIPTPPEYQPVVGGEQTYQTAYLVGEKLNPEFREAFFVLTLVDGRKKGHRQYSAYLREKYGANVCKTEIRTSTNLAVTPANGESVFDYAPRCRGATDYANLVDELLGFPAFSAVRDRVLSNGIGTSVRRQSSLKAE